MPRSSPPSACMSTAAPTDAKELRMELCERIKGLTKKLRSEHDEYEQAAQSWTEEAAEKKRDARKAREGTLHEIEQLLAQDDEGDRVAHLQRLPFARKLAELEIWVERRPAVQDRRKNTPVSEVVSIGPIAVAPAAPEREPARRQEPQPRACPSPSSDQ